MILNFDESIHLSDSPIIHLQDWQEKIRFGCSMKTFNQLRDHLLPQLPEHYGTVMMGSGDYHHISTLLIQQIAQKINQPFQVVVLDNHPDNMRFPFGIHCGSWISHIAKLPYISHVHVLGMTSSDVELAHSWETRLKPLYAGKLTNWCLNVNVGWAHKIGLRKAFKVFTDVDTMIQAFMLDQQTVTVPTYLSIDKDVLSKDVVQTNWDQGIMNEAQLMAIIQALKPNLVGSDITGEVSLYDYQTWWKRLLSGFDQPISLADSEIAAWQTAQNALNERLINALRLSY